MPFRPSFLYPIPRCFSHHGTEHAARELPPDPTNKMAPLTPQTRAILVARVGLRRQQTEIKRPRADQGAPRGSTISFIIALKVFLFYGTNLIRAGTDEDHESCEVPAAVRILPTASAAVTTFFHNFHLFNSFNLKCTRRSYVHLNILAFANRVDCAATPCVSVTRELVGQRGKEAQGGGAVLIVACGRVVSASSTVVGS